MWFRPRADRAPSHPVPLLDGLRAETQALLQSRRQPPPEPIRAVLFGGERFRQHGVSLAKAQPIERRRSGRRRGRRPHFFPRIAANLVSLGRTRRYLELLDRHGEPLGPAAEWLLDNFHLIEAQVTEIRNALPPAYYSALPTLREPPLAGLPRVYGIAWAFVAHTDSSFDAGLLIQFLGAYQQVDVLTLGELWAIPTTLRVVLLENLARLAEAVAGDRAAQEAAECVCNQEPPPTADEVDAVFKGLIGATMQTAFLAHLVQRSRDRVAAEPLPWSAWLVAAAPDPDAVQAAAHGLQAAANVSVSNAVSALQAINNLEWTALVERVSPVLQAMGACAAFVANSELTRDQCTHAIEHVARRLHCSELQVADHALALARAQQADPARWLIGDRRAALIADLDRAAHPLGAPVRRWLTRSRGAAYGASLLVGTAIVLDLLLASSAPPPGLAWLTLPFAALAAFEAVGAVVNRMVAESYRVRRLPRLALERGLGSEHRTLVVVPCMLTDIDGIRALAQRLEQHHLANLEAHVRFALLSDWTDAPERHSAADASLLDAARQSVVALNARHPTAPGELPRFALLHRERSWSESERAWIGWERKRGKLEQLLAALADAPPGASGPFIDLGECSRLGDGVRYVVTLDSDTTMPPGTVRELVSIAAHPLNRPEFDPASGRVVSGYGILQPRIDAPLPAREQITAFGWLFAGPWGFDVYSAGSSEVYQDLFAQGSFSGKGLLDVQAMNRALRGRIPENQVLSHDLYEGAWARAAFLSDVSLVEAAPMHPDVAASRVHRWTRGDWQLLPLLGDALRGRVGVLNLWKMLDNLRRSLLAPASFVLLWLGASLGVPQPALALALVAAAFGAGPLLGALAGLLPGRRDLAWRHFLRGGGADLARALGGTLWQLATLPLAAATQADAIARALWRSAVSRRYLMQWTTAEQAQTQAGRAWGWFWRQHWGSSALAIAWLLAGAWLPGASLPWLLGIGTLWALTPVWLWLASQPLPVRHAEPGLSGPDRAYLQQLARDTWRFFETTVTAADHHLPPDNLQLDPEPTLARRTSPTNIGLYLASCACARRLGFIDTPSMASRIEATLDTLEQLPRLHGHFHNWIDTGSLQVLAPAYVSTVDSGNLAASLWMVAAACRQWAEAQAQDDGVEGAPDARLAALAERLDGLVAAMDFSVLHDARRRLFHIGYRADQACLDPGYYDLLASESRLASYVAIAKGDVPRAHWQVLGRPFVAVRQEPMLRSWSGSMFEYLMPALFLREPDGGLLQRVSRMAVRAQRDFGARLGVPWGVSESAYFERDGSLAFQYGPFGIPDLALRRTPMEDRVVAPYASVLASLIDAPAALANLRELERLDARAELGFIEALDFSPHRLDEPARPQRVATHMAHHQGMALLALCHLLCDEAPRAWFDGVPMARAFRSLLHERMPRVIVVQSRTIPRPPHRPGEPAGAGRPRVIDPALGPQAAGATLLLGNGAYSLSLRPNGAGQSHWRGHALTRARDDLPRDAFGQWLMLRRTGEPGYHSITQAPHPKPGARHETRYFADRAEFEAVCDAWQARVDIWVSPEDDVELRRVTLHNLGESPADFELASLFEAVLATQRADEAHPAFSNLFVRAQAPDPGCLVLQRKPRGPGERGLWLAHFVATCDIAPETVHLACDRAGELPRGGTMGQFRPTPARPAGDADVLDTGLDPVASLAIRLHLPAHARRCVTIATAAAEDLDTLMAIVDEYRQDVHLARSRLMSDTLARIRQREWRLSAGDGRLVQDLTTWMTTSRSRLRPAPEVVVDRRALWRFAISGDRPLLLVRIGTEAGLRTLRTLLVAQRMWQTAGLGCDLVVLNGEPQSYLMPLQHRIAEARDGIGAHPQDHHAQGNIHVLAQAELTPGEWAALRAAARLELVADGAPLERQLAQSAAPGTAPRSDRAAAIVCRRGADAPWPDGAVAGGFADGGRRYAFDIDARRGTPRPWANVLANPGFGCIVTESGGGYTWAGNSRMNQLTPWSNDPLLDPPGEHFLVHDLRNDEVFGLLPTWDRNGDQGYRVSHEAGSSRFTHTRAGLAVDARVWVHPDMGFKCVQWRLRNTGAQRRSLRLVGMVEWVLGAQRSDRMTLVTEYLPGLQATLARQVEHSGGFGEGTALLMLTGAAVSEWSCARAEFFDATGRLQVPARLSGTQGFGLDPCGALAAAVQLGPGQVLEGGWVVGHAPGRPAAIELARGIRDTDLLADAPQQVAEHWDRLQSAVTVSTPDPLFDALVNHWLLYQAVSCRLWARAGFYQASGATGFRDQLQDALALVWTRPDLLRRQLLLHASRQFAAGDVQHWWHQPSGAGVRTHFSDDLLWLPHATQRYLETSGDEAVLDEPVSFLEGEAVADGAEDAYFIPTVSSQRASLYEHAARAIDHALRVGPHGLPLIGGGDWNDGMNRVGHEGRGESVWLGWFLLSILRDWVPLARRRGDEARATRWEGALRALPTALAEQGWDGDWFRRAYFDNGHALGSQANDECRIDLIAQAWSVLAPPSIEPRARQAMASADAILVDRHTGLVRLLDPPLQQAADDAGYIQAYPPGVRENGGQYSHGAVWAVLAQARLGNAEKAWEYFRMLSPAHRVHERGEQQRYGLEPYVMAGDTCSAPPHAGRGGWSWYTGAAAWMHRAAIESLLGLRLRRGRFSLQPCLPPAWPEARIRLVLHGKAIDIVLRRGLGADDETRGLAPTQVIEIGQWLDIEALVPSSTLWLAGLPPLPAAAPHTDGVVPPSPSSDPPAHAAGAREPHDLLP